MRAALPGSTASGSAPAASSISRTSLRPVVSVPVGVKSPCAMRRPHRWRISATLIFWKRAPSSWPPARTSPPPAAEPLRGRYGEPIARRGHHRAPRYPAVLGRLRGVGRAGLRDRPVDADAAARRSRARWGLLRGNYYGNRSVPSGIRTRAQCADPHATHTGPHAEEPAVERGWSEPLRWAAWPSSERTLPGRNRGLLWSQASPRGWGPLRRRGLGSRPDRRTRRSVG